VKRVAVLAVLAVALVLLIPTIWKPNKKTLGEDNKITDAVVMEVATSTPPGATNILIGETILRGYADTNLPPENDLTLMLRLMENSLLLLKAAANRPLSANEDWADMLRGRNGASEQFLPVTHVALNSSGQLVDRWGTPLFFHSLGSGRYELRSAGPDKKLWTTDDLHRNADGSFRRGGDLNPASLHESVRQH